MQHVRHRIDCATLLVSVSTSAWWKEEGVPKGTVLSGRAPSLS